MKYIEKDIYPLYVRNDWAHQIWHIHEAVERSLKLAKNYSVDGDMVFVIAAFHDLGCFIDRGKHEEISAQMMVNDRFIQKHFSVDNIRVMKEAIIDHRGSLGYEPRSIYGKIIASADRFTTIEGILRSTHSYMLEFFPDMPWDEMVERSHEYIKRKYGKGGYAKGYIPNPDLDEVEIYLSDRGKFEEKLREVDKFLRKEYIINK